MIAAQKTPARVNGAQVELPEGWRWVRLGDICVQDRQVIEPRTEQAAKLPYLSLEHIESNTGRILRHPAETMTDEGRSTTFAFDTRHVLYGKLRPYLNKVALPEFRGRCTTELIPLLPTQVDREYLAWLLRRTETVSVAMSEKTGSRMPRADLEALLNLLVPVPSMPEQKGIASILNEQMAAVDRARAAAEAQLQAARALPAAYLREVFESEEARSWSLRPFGLLVDNFDSRRIPVKLDERRGKKGPYPYYGASGIIDYVDSYLFDGEYLLISEDGANLLMRSSPIAFRAAGKFWVNNHAHVVQPKTGIELDFLRHFLEITDLKPYVTGAAQPKLTQDDMNSIPIPVPDHPEQQRIVAHLNERITRAGQATKGLEVQLEEINTLPAALLRQAFSGGL